MRPKYSMLTGALVGTVLSFSTVIHPSQADETALDALAARDLAPAAEIFAKEALFEWSPGGETALADDGFTVRLPAGDPAIQVLVGGPANSVIADLVLEKGPLAMSPRVAQALGLRPDNTHVLQILALKQRPRASGVPVPGVSTPVTQRSAESVPGIVQ